MLIRDGTKGTSEGVERRAQLWTCLYLRVEYGSVMRKLFKACLLQHDTADVGASSFITYCCRQGFTLIMALHEMKVKQPIDTFLTHFIE